MSSKSKHVKNTSDEERMNRSASGYVCMHVCVDVGGCGKRWDRMASQILNAQYRSTGKVG